MLNSPIAKPSPSCNQSIPTTKSSILPTLTVATLSMPPSPSAVFRVGPSSSKASDTFDKPSTAAYDRLLSSITKLRGLQWTVDISNDCLDKLEALTTEAKQNNTAALNGLRNDLYARNSAFKNTQSKLNDALIEKLCLRVDYLAQAIEVEHMANFAKTLEAENRALRERRDLLKEFVGVLEEETARLFAISRNHTTAETKRTGSQY